MIIMHDHHAWSSPMIIIHHHHAWSSYMIIIHDHHTWSSCMIIIHDHHAWSSCMIIIHDRHAWWSCMIIVSYGSFYFVGTLNRPPPNPRWTPLRCWFSSGKSIPWGRHTRIRWGAGGGSKKEVQKSDICIGEGYDGTVECLKTRMKWRKWRKMMKKLTGLDIFLLTKTSFFDFTKSKWSEWAHIKNLGVIFHPRQF